MCKNGCKKYVQENSILYNFAATYLDNGLHQHPHNRKSPVFKTNNISKSLYYFRYVVKYFCTEHCTSYSNCTV